MELFYEQVVHKNKNISDIFKKALIISLVIVIPLLFIIIGNVSGHIYYYLISFFSLLLCIYGAWYFWTCLNIDYEYSINESILTVSKITNNRKLTRMLRLDVKNIVKFGKYNPQEYDNATYEKVYNASKDCDSDLTYAAVFTKSGSGGKYMLLFSPDERALLIIRRFIRV